MHDYIEYGLGKVRPKQKGREICAVLCCGAHGVCVFGSLQRHSHSCLLLRSHRNSVLFDLRWSLGLSLLVLWGVMLEILIISLKVRPRAALMWEPKR